MSFGGWKQPFAKQYKGDVTVCGLGVDLNYSPSISGSGSTAVGRVSGGPKSAATKTAPKPSPSSRSSAVTSGNANVYTYSQASHTFSGIGSDGSPINTVNACSGALGSCRNNPSCQCKSMIGPLPVGSYRIVGPFTWKGMVNCFELDPFPSNRMCGRSGFLIHGGNCSPPYNPSEGCIVIQDPNLRGRIKGGTILNVVSGLGGGTSSTPAITTPSTPVSRPRPNPVPVLPVASTGATSSS